MTRQLNGRPPEALITVPGPEAAELLRNRNPELWV